MEQIILDSLARAFNLPSVKSIRRYGSGHIHQTYLIETSAEKYVAQEFNTKVFKDPKLVEENYQQLRLQLQGNDVFHLEYLPSLSGSIFHEVAGQLWRVSPFLADTITFETCDDPEIAFRASCAFANFSKSLSSAGLTFTETIPHFLSPAYRFEQLQSAISLSTAQRKEHANDLITAYNQSNPTGELEKWSSQLPKRTIHGDTKVNNILFRRNKKVYSVIDIDTVMPGLIMCDFGDLVRTTCSKAAEDDPSMDNSGMKKTIYTQLKKGYIQCGFLTRAEIESLDFGARLMTWLTGVRFLTDYLNGDVYYKIERDGQNLDRAQSQINFLHKLPPLNH